MAPGEATQRLGALWQPHSEPLSRSSISHETKLGRARRHRKLLTAAVLRVVGRLS